MLLISAGCKKNNQTQTEPGGPRVENISHGPIKATITADPPEVQLNKDIFLTIQITAPSEMEIQIPPIDDRLQGFISSGSYDSSDAADESGKIRLERRARITPILAEEYRIAPMAITYTDKGRSPPETSWFTTPAIVFKTHSIIEGTPPNDITELVKPLWIRPAPRQVVSFIFAGMLIIAVILLLLRLLKKIQHEIKVRRMTPKERAIYELAELMGMKLIEKDQIKEFYLILTMIVRHYIERQYTVKAPEQTTPEFLDAASKDPRFSRETVLRLKAFLESADFVKFAAYHPSRESIDNIIFTAKDYIEKDTDVQPAVQPQEHKHV